MKKLLHKQTATVLAIIFVMLTAVSSTAVRAQNREEPMRDDPPPQASQDAGWKDLLNLTPDQMERIRTIRQETFTEAQAARRRARQAQRALDQAIYADNASEAEIEQRTRELLEAQAAEVRLRARTELSIRRVLTAEQLNIFRRIRQERMNAQRQRRMGNGVNGRGPGNSIEGRPARQGRRNVNSSPPLGPPRRIRP